MQRRHLTKPHDTRRALTTRCLVGLPVLALIVFPGCGGDVITAPTEEEASVVLAHRVQRSLEGYELLLGTDLTSGLQLHARCQDLHVAPLNQEDAEKVPDAFFECRLFSGSRRSGPIRLGWDHDDEIEGGRYSAVIGDRVLF